MNTKRVVPAAAALLVALLGIVSTLAILPASAAADGEECSGREMPVCKSVKSCVSVNGGPFDCETDYYYYPAES